MPVVSVVAMLFYYLSFTHNSVWHPEKDGLTILWIAVRYSLYKETEIEKYQAVNNPSKPLESLTRAQLNKVLVQIAEIIKEKALS